MALNAVKTIRALKRGIGVMRALDAHGAMSLDQLHRLTGIPKPTLSRILLTLRDENHAFQRIADNKWVSGPGIGSTHVADITHNLLVQAAIPELTTLCRRVIWPSDLTVRSGLSMMLVESSRPHTTLILNKLSVGLEIDFLLSAPGRAYLAFCPEEEQNQILEKLRTRPEYAFLFETGRMKAILQEVRAQGFGHRDSLWGGRAHEFRKDYDDGLDAIAVPIKHGQAVLGCVNIVWIRSLLSRKAIVDRHLPDLLEVAVRISSSFDQKCVSKNRRRDPPSVS